MDRYQYEKLCQICKDTLLHRDSTRATIAINWLHITKWHPESVRQYKYVFYTSEFIKFFTRQIFSCRFRLVRLIRTAKSMLQKDIWISSSPIGASDILFVSHLVNSDLIGKKDDFYFGSLPVRLTRHKITSSIALIDHLGSHNKQKIKSWDDHNVTRVVLSRVLPFLLERSLYRLQLLEAKRLSRGSLKHSRLHKEVMRWASIHASSNITTNALRISLQVERLIRKLNPKAMVITYEGYSWERLVFAAAKKANPSILCVGYAHMAILESQNSMMTDLMRYYNPDIVLASGIVGEKILNDKMLIKSTKVKNMGSPRSLATYSTVSDGAETYNACVVIPEGTLTECNILFEFSLECAERMPQIDFIWRLHPLLDFPAIIKNNPKFKDLPENIILSNKSLEQDMVRSSFALYRGSTAIVPLITHGLIPMYYRLESDLFSIDPLYEYNDGLFAVDGVTDFERIVDVGHRHRYDKDGLICYGKSFYTQLDETVLTEILN